RSKRDWRSDVCSSDLKPSPLQNGPELGWLSRAMHEPYLASLQPMVAFTNPSPEIEVSDIFDERPSPYHRGEKNFYYIKKRYYTRSEERRVGKENGRLL